MRAIQCVVWDMGWAGLDWTRDGDRIWDGDGGGDDLHYYLDFEESGLAFWTGELVCGCVEVERKRGMCMCICM